MPTPEEIARQEIDRLLALAGWAVQDLGVANLHAARGVAVREFSLLPSHGKADYLLYVDGKACGVIEAKKQGTPLRGVEVQSGCYAKGLPPELPAWLRPLPFSYESTGVETHFTSGLDPAPRARPVFAFHQPQLLAEWLKLVPQATAVAAGPAAPVAQAPVGVQAFEQVALATARSVTLLTCKGKGVQASGYASSQGFVVKAGSLATASPNASFQKARGMSALRDDLIKSGVLVAEGAAYRFTQDYAFSSPSAASDLVLGGSTNGRLQWKDASGKTLKDLQAQELAA